MRRHLWIFAGLVLLLVLGTRDRIFSQEGSISPDEIGLSKVGIREIAVPDEVLVDTSDPGDEAAVIPVYQGSPPVIPHGIVDFLPIMSDENACIDCHMLDEDLEGEPTPIPVSHYVDLRNAPDVVQEEVAGARFNCTACHVSLTEAIPLVDNTFVEED